MRSKLFESQKGQQFSGFKTICEIHRQLYDVCILNLHKKDPEILCEIIPILEEAFLMGIKLVNKLIEHKIHELSLYEETHDTVNVIARRNKRIELVKTLEANMEILKDE